MQKTQEGSPMAQVLSQDEVDALLNAVNDDDSADNDNDSRPTDTVWNTVSTLNNADLPNITHDLVWFPAPSTNGFYI